MGGLFVGLIVHYVTPRGEHRPAIVVKVWPKPGAVNLQVFTDGPNDGKPGDCGVQWVSTIEHSPTPRPYTWHFLEVA